MLLLNLYQSNTFIKSKSINFMAKKKKVSSKKKSKKTKSKKRK